MTFLRCVAAVVFGVLTVLSAHATPDLENGKAVDKQKCYAWYARKSGFGNGDMIYTRTDGKVKSTADLKNGWLMQYRVASRFIS